MIILVLNPECCRARRRFEVVEEGQGWRLRHIYTEYVDLHSIYT